MQYFLSLYVCVILLGRLPQSTKIRIQWKAAQCFEDKLVLVLLLCDPSVAGNVPN